MLPLTLVSFVAFLLLPALAMPPAQPAPPSWLQKCLPLLRPAALQMGAPLPTDSPRSADQGTCAARCEARCFLLGDFDGDGRARELAVASPTELLLFQDVDRGRSQKLRAAPVARLPLSGDEVALVSIQRAVRFADEVGMLRDGKSPLPQLGKGERLALGLILWHGGQKEGEPEEEIEGDDLRTGETGDLLVAIFDETARTYRLQRILQLGWAAP